MTLQLRNVVRISIDNFSRPIELFRQKGVLAAAGRSFKVFFFCVWGGVESGVVLRALQSLRALVFSTLDLFNICLSCFGIILL